MKNCPAMGVLRPNNITTSNSPYNHWFASSDHDRSQDALIASSNYSTDAPFFLSRVENNITDNQRVTNTVRNGIESVSIPESSLISGKYIPSDLINELIKGSGKRVVLVRSGLGTGKSTALASLMHSNYEGRGVAICHRVGLTRQLCSSFSADYYESIKTEAGIESERIGTTIHSLPMVCRADRARAAFDRGLLIVDESNSVSAEINSDVIKNEPAVIGALKQACQSARTVVCADAHLDQSTINLMLACGFDRNDMLLINVIKPELAGYKVKLWQDEGVVKGKSKGRSAFINQILADLSDGLKVTVTSLSAAFLEVLNREAGKRGVNKVMITSKTPLSVREALNAESYQDYDLVMLSPSLSTGISFDRTVTLGDGTVTPCPDYRHADRVYVMLTNAQGTGTHQDGLQAMLRERAVGNKTINCMYQESPIPLTTPERALLAQESRIAMLEKLIVENGWEVPRDSRSESQSLLINQSVLHAEQKQEFLSLFAAECESKGAELTYCELSELTDGDVTQDTIDADNLAERDAWIAERVNAPALPDDESAVDLSDDALKPALDRQYIENQLCVDWDSLQESERTDLVNQVFPAEGAGIMPTIRKIERAYADEKLLKRVVKAAVVGVSGGDGDKVRFIEKMRTEKALWLSQAKYTRLVLKAVGVTESDGVLSLAEGVVIDDRVIKDTRHPANGLCQSIINNPVAAIDSGLVDLETDPAHVKKAPLLYILRMATALGIKTRKKRKAQSWAVQADSVAPLLAIVNRRKHAGINELKARCDLFDEYQAKYTARMHYQSMRDMQNRSPVCVDAERMASAAMQNLGAPELTQAATEYLEPYFGRIKQGRFTQTTVDIILRNWCMKMA